MSRVIVSFLAGLVFALGLGLAGMTDPAKVAAFLNLRGAWDPSLALVMAAAIAVHVLPARASLVWSRPLLDDRFHTAPFRTVEPNLVVGSVLFGAGWGLAGYCPGPAVVSAFAGRAEALWLTGAMLAGFGLHAALAAARVAPAAADE
jgi:uncharacterized membrane protein YedE/YeeE